MLFRESSTVVRARVALAREVHSATAGLARYWGLGLGGRRPDDSSSMWLGLEEDDCLPCEQPSSLRAARAQVVPDGIGWIGIWRDLQ